MVQRFWPQLTAIIIVSVGFGRYLNSLDTVWTEMGAVEKEHDNDVQVLNTEDDGVRADFERADDCNREVARLENEVMYWKLKYEFK